MFQLASLVSIFGPALANDPRFLPALIQHAHIEKQPKGTVLVRAGELCRKMYVVQQGLLRFYYEQEGKDITHWFVFEGSPITDVNSFFNQQPSEYFLETLEPSVLITLTASSLEALLAEFPAMERTGRLMMQEILVALGEKVQDLQFRSATERYERLLAKHPDILQRANLGHIASYLGITQQSLSRIRSQQ